MSHLEKVIAKIEAQQTGKEGTDVFMVGEQLKDICKDSPVCAELVAVDLDNPQMGIESAAKQLKEYADKQPRKGNCVCISPAVAEGILRKFYGLPERGKPETESLSGMLDLRAFL